MTIEEVKSNNPDIAVIHVNDAGFKAFGKVLKKDLNTYVEYMEKNIPIPGQGVDYAAEDTGLMTLEKERHYLETEVYGQMPVEVGFCAGHNQIMDGMEWHYGCEVNVAVTDLVLFLAEYSSLEHSEDGKVHLNSRQVKAVYVPKGYAIVLDPLVLHFTPIEVQKEGFGTVVALPAHTNEALLEATADPYLKARNSWIIYHKDTGRGSEIDGINLKLKYK